MSIKTRKTRKDFKNLQFHRKGMGIESEKTMKTS